MARRSSQEGFTPIELMIVVTIISIAVPRLVSARVSANENATIGTLRTIVAAQTQMIASGASAPHDDDARRRARSPVGNPAYRLHPELLDLQRTSRRTRAASPACGPSRPTSPTSKATARGAGCW